MLFGHIKLLFQRLSTTRAEFVTEKEMKKKVYDPHTAGVQVCAYVTRGSQGTPRVDRESFRAKKNLEAKKYLLCVAMFS